MVRRERHPAAVPVRVRTFLHHVHDFACPVDARLAGFERLPGELRRDEHGELRGRGGGAGLSGIAGGDPGASQAPGGIYEGISRTRHGAEGDGIGGRGIVRASIVLLGHRNRHLEYCRWRLHRVRRQLLARSGGGRAVRREPGTEAPAARPPRAVTRGPYSFFLTGGGADFHCESVFRPSSAIMPSISFRRSPYTGSGGSSGLSARRYSAITAGLSGLSPCVRASAACSARPVARCSARMAFPLSKASLARSYFFCAE